MTSRVLANPRRTSLAALSLGSELASCTGTSVADCGNIAVRVVEGAQGRRLLCRTCAD